MDGTRLTKKDEILLDDFCEGCGRVVPCVVRYRSPLEKAIWKLLHGKDRK